MNRTLNLRALAILSILQIFGSPLSAQEELLTLDPPLRDSFPLQSVPGGVRVKYSVLLNDHTVLHPEAVLRFIYLDPNAAARSRAGVAAAADDKEPGYKAHVGPGGALTSGNPDDTPSVRGGAGGWGDSNGNDVAGIYDSEKRDDSKRRKSELETEIWTRPDLFTDALDHATELGTIVVYSLPSETKPITAPLDLPEGMLLAEVDGHIKVLGLAENSRAYAGGIRPGDEIRSFNTGEPVATLGDFIREFSATKRQARLTGNPTYSIQISRADQPISIQIAAPPSIPTFL